MACGMYFSKEHKGNTYILNVRVSADKFEVKEKMKLDAPEPITIAPTVNQQNGKVKISVSLTDAFERQVSVSKSGKDMAPPVLKITGPDGQEVAKYEFQPG